MWLTKKNTKYVSSKINSNDGFTIVELMIALTILSVILVISTVITTQIGALYSKGVNSANLQNATRKTMAEISSSLQLSGTLPHSCTATTLTCYAMTSSQSIGTVTSDVYSYCVDGTRYTFVLNRELGTDNSTSVVTPHVLWHDTIKTNVCAVLDLTAASPSDANSNGDGYEMLPESARLTRFKITDTPVGSGLYAIDIWTAYGDDDLLSVDADGHARCVGTKGTQYCASSELSETTLRRVE